MKRNVKFLGLALAAVVFVATARPNTGSLMIGAVLIALGVALDSLSVHAMTERGIKKITRYPQEAALLLICTGLAFAQYSAPFLAGTLVATALWIRRRARHADAGLPTLRQHASVIFHFYGVLLAIYKFTLR